MGFGPDACWGTGPRPSGAACNDGSQCTSMFCRHQPLSCGVCETMPDIGATCAESVDCGRGRSCTPDGTCQGPRVLGETCSLSALPCRADFACVQGKCVALPASVGASCDWQNGQGCDIARSYACDTVTGRCLAIAWADAGEYCGNTAAGATKCVREGVCATDTCVPALADHASCDVNLGPPCEWPARCSTDTNTCLLP